MKYRNKIFLLIVSVAASLTVVASPIFAATLLTPEGSGSSDTTLPSDVENVRAQPGDSKVTLSWDIATDNVEVTGYKIFYGTNSVRREGEEYNLGVMNVEDVVSHTAENLRNGTTYYFAVVAVDSSGNESENYSFEVSATPAPGLLASQVEDDQKNPEVDSAEAFAADSVRVVFSEPIVLPLESPEHAFFIEKKNDGSELKVKRAELDPSDDNNTSVVLLTDPQEEGTMYVIVVDQLVTDFYENAVKNGENDRAEFEGYRSPEVAETPAIENDTAPQANEAPASPVDSVSPTVLKTEAETSSRVRIDFSEPLALADYFLEQFLIHEKDDEEKTLKILAINMSVDKKSVFLTTDPQEEKEYVVSILDVTDVSGNALDTQVLSDNPAQVTFTGMSSSLRDLIPPEDVTELIATLVNPSLAQVTLSWQASKNSAGDLSDQLLYQSLDRGKNYGAGKSLGKDATSITLEKLQGGREYTWKVTVKDEAGNESTGTTVTLFLPKTGPALPVAFALSMVVGYWFKKRRKKV